MNKTLILLFLLIVALWFSLFKVNKEYFGFPDDSNIVSFRSDETGENFIDIDNERRDELERRFNEAYENIGNFDDGIENPFSEGNIERYTEGDGRLSEDQIEIIRRMTRNDNDTGPRWNTTDDLPPIRLSRRVNFVTEYVNGFRSPFYEANTTIRYVNGDEIPHTTIRFTDDRSIHYGAYVEDGIELNTEYTSETVHAIQGEYASNTPSLEPIVRFAASDASAGEDQQLAVPTIVEPTQRLDQSEITGHLMKIIELFNVSDDMLPLELERYFNNTSFTEIITDFQSLNGTVKLDSERLQDLQRKLTHISEQILKIISDIHTDPTRMGSLGDIFKHIPGIVDIWVKTQPFTQEYIEQDNVPYFYNSLDGRLTIDPSYVSDHLTSDNLINIFDFTAKIGEYVNNKEGALLRDGAGGIVRSQKTDEQLAMNYLSGHDVALVNSEYVLGLHVDADGKYIGLDDSAEPHNFPDDSNFTVDNYHLIYEWTNNPRDFNKDLIRGSNLTGLSEWQYTSKPSQLYEALSEFNRNKISRVKSVYSGQTRTKKNFQDMYGPGGTITEGGLVTSRSFISAGTIQSHSLMFADPEGTKDSSRQGHIMMIMTGKSQVPIEAISMFRRDGNIEMRNSSPNNMSMLRNAATNYEGEYLSRPATVWRVDSIVHGDNKMIDGLEHYFVTVSLTEVEPPTNRHQLIKRLYNGQNTTIESILGSGYDTPWEGGAKRTRPPT